MSVRLMVVDDHRLLAEALASALKLRGHRVLAAAAPTSGSAELVVSRAPEVCLFGTASPAAPGGVGPQRAQGAGGPPGGGGGVGAGAAPAGGGAGRGGA
ncbi:DNA-binding response regulator, partial [Streptomyces microflavus]